MTHHLKILTECLKIRDKTGTIARGNIDILPGKHKIPDYTPEGPVRTGMKYKKRGGLINDYFYCFFEIQSRQINKVYAICYLFPNIICSIPGYFMFAGLGVLKQKSLYFLSENIIYSYLNF